MRQLLISALGALSYSFDGFALGGLDHDKVSALLLLLAMQPDQVQTRAALCALLWPDVQKRSARTSLSQVLTRLRKSISVDAQEPLLLATTNTVQLNTARNVAIMRDARVFEQQVNDAEAHSHRPWKTCARCAEHQTEAILIDMMTKALTHI